jgi:hypothetical protein
MLRVQCKRKFGFQGLIRSSLLGAIVCLGRLCLQSLTFKSQRLGFLSIAARFQQSFLDWVSCLKGIAGLQGFVPSLLHEKHAILVITDSLKSSIASQSRLSLEDSRVCTFFMASQESFSASQNRILTLESTLLSASRVVCKE